MVTFAKTEHSAMRQQQRGLRDEVVEFVLTYGRAEYGAGAVWYTIRHRDLPGKLRSSAMVEKARRWVIVTSPVDESVITAYARRDPARHVRRKACRHNHPRRSGRWDDRHTGPVSGTYSRAPIPAN